MSILSFRNFTPQPIIALSFISDKIKRMLKNGTQKI